MGGMLYAFNVSDFGVYLVRRSCLLEEKRKFFHFVVDWILCGGIELKEDGVWKGFGIGKKCNGYYRSIWTLYVSND